jgi:aconitase A
MGAEVGATTSTFPYTPQMRAYLNATGRAPVARAADAAAVAGFLSPDEGAEYDEVIEIVRNCLIIWILVDDQVSEFVGSGTNN